MASYASWLVCTWAEHNADDDAREEDAADSAHLAPIVAAELDGNQVAKLSGLRPNKTSLCVSRKREMR